VSTHSIPPRARSLNARAAALQRHRPNETAAIAEARRDAKFSTLSDYIQRTVDAAPPLTSEQRERLAVLLRPIPSAGDVA
jgi:hypothetical protein